MTIEYGALIGGLATATAAGVGLVLTSRQIRLTRESDQRSDSWRRVDFVRTIVDDLGRDEQVQFCLRALDWGVGPLPIPSTHRKLFSDRPEIMEQDPRKMERALHVALPSDWRDPEILTYRHSFDHFFSALDAVVVYGERLGDEFTNDVGLSYHLDLIRHPPYIGSRDGRSPLYDFIGRFYPRLNRLIWHNKP